MHGSHGLSYLTFSTNMPNKFYVSYLKLNHCITHINFISLCSERNRIFCGLYSGKISVQYLSSSSV